MSDPAVRRALTTNELRAALEDRYGMKPSYGAIRTAISRGMPHHTDALYLADRFYLDDVIAWLESAGRDIAMASRVKTDARRAARATTP